MDSFKLAIKFFADASTTLHSDELVPVFHQWIQKSVVAGHQLIDVADYKHVHQGPGVLLIAHEGHFGYDLSEGKPGLIYLRQRTLAGNFDQRLAFVTKQALLACDRLEKELPGKVKFRTDAALFRISDKLLAPNSAATFQQVEPGIGTLFRSLMGPGVKLEHRQEPHRPFEVMIRSQTNLAVSELAAKIAG